jgi:hypothetical protein
MSLFITYIEGGDIKPLIKNACKEMRETVFHKAVNNDNLEIVEILYPYMDQTRIDKAIEMAMTLEKGKESVKWLLNKQILAEFPELLKNLEINN